MLTVADLVAITAGCGSTPGSKVTTAGVQLVWNSSGMTRLMARALIAVVLDTMPIVAAPVAIANPHEPVQCTPVGVTKKPDGSVWAVEDCDGEKIHYRLPDK